jgi:hypothetical protein
MKYSIHPLGAGGRVVLRISTGDTLGDGYGEVRHNRFFPSVEAAEAAYEDFVNLYFKAYNIPGIQPEL